MSDTRESEAPLVRVYRSWGNTAVGWFLGYGLLVGMLALDPLGAYSTWEDGASGVNVFNLLLVVWFALISCGSFAVFGRPRVEASAEGLVLRNVRRDVSLAWEQIDALDSESSAHLMVLSGGRRYRAWGTEKGNLAWVVGAGGASAGAARVLETRRPTGATTHGATSRADPVRIRRPERAEVFLLAGWCGYAAVSVATHFFGTT